MGRTRPGQANKRSLSELSKRKIKTGDAQPNYEVTVGKLTLSPKLGRTLLKSVAVSYSAESGTSEALIQTSVPLEEYTGAPVRVRFGYGDRLASYFNGALGPSEDDEWASTYSAPAWGPFKEMSEQILGEQVDFRGWSLLDAFLDLFRRAGIGRNRLDIRAGANFTIEGDDAIFPFEAKLADIGNSIASSAGYIVTDMPDNRRLVKPKPRVGARSPIKVRYEEGDVPENGFKAVSSVRNTFSRAVIFRRNEEGGFDFEPQFANVTSTSRYRTPPNKWYVISDYLGSEADARKDVQALAELLSGGMFECELSGVGVNPEIFPHDAVLTEQRKMKDRGGRTKDPVLATYVYNASNTITASLEREAGQRMTVSGLGLLLKEKVLPKPFYMTQRSQYAVRP